VAGVRTRADEGKLFAVGRERELAGGAAVVDELLSFEVFSVCICDVPYLAAAEKEDVFAICCIERRAAFADNVFREL